MATQYGLTRYSNLSSPAFGAVDSAKAAFTQGNTDAGMQHLEAADAIARQQVAGCRLKDAQMRAQLPRVTGAAKARVQQDIAHNMDFANGHIALRGKIAQVKRVAPGKAFVRAQAGYYPAAPNQSVAAPAGAGLYLRVPLRGGISAISPLNALGTQAFEAITPAVGIDPLLTMRTPDIPWLLYRVRGILFDRQSDAAGALDSITVQRARIRGGPTFITGEDPVGIESFRMTDSDRVGLRYHGEVESPNTVEVILSANGGTAAAAHIAPAGNTVIAGSVLIEVLEDAIYGKVNNPEVRAQVLRDAQAMGLTGGYSDPNGTPVASTLERVPMRVQTATAANMVNDTRIQLTNVANVVALISEQIEFADNQVVGMEVATPIKADITDIALFSGLEVRGGSVLFPQEDEVPVVNYLGDQGGVRGGGSAALAGLRTYPRLSDTNRAIMTLQGRVGLTGLAGLTGGTITIPYINLLVNRIHDDIFGPGTGAPFAQKALAVLA